MTKRTNWNIEKARAIAVDECPDDESLLTWGAKGVDALRWALDRIEELEKAHEWRPIETAPKDGTLVALLTPWVEVNTRKTHLSPCCGLWDEDEGLWVSEDSDPGEPIAWTPLPDPPTQEGDER